LFLEYAKLQTTIVLMYTTAFMKTK